MQTRFTDLQRQDADLRESEAQLRRCVHCGFCLATCPTYVLLGDERDSPRGRILLMQHMLENRGPVSEEVVTHVDRCLSCLACQTTCPSDVHYMHLVDHARAYIEKHYERPLPERWLRWLLGQVLPRPGWFRWALHLSALGRPFVRWTPARMRPLIALAPRGARRWSGPEVTPALGERRRRVALLVGCVQSVLDADTHDATVRLLSRAGCEVLLVDALGCCGAVNHHLGQAHQAHERVVANVRALAPWLPDLDAVVATVAGCGTMLKDYGHLLRDDPDLAEAAATVSERARDVTEILAEVGLPEPAAPVRLRVAYQAACSLQHGQGLRTEPVDLLRAAGFEVVEPTEAHLCCGSAGTYNLLQPELAVRLGERKVAALEATEPDLVATGNVGCALQLRPRTRLPVVHTAQLLDWATGGPRPRALGPDPA